MLTIDADAGAKGELERVEKLEAAANNDTESFDNNMITAEPSQEVSNETAPVRATNDVVPEQDEVVGQASPEDAMPVDTIGTVAQEFVLVQTNHSPLGINKGIATDQDTNGNTAEKEEANGANSEIKETEKDRNENGLVAEKGEDGAIEQNPGDSRDSKTQDLLLKSFPRTKTLKVQETFTETETSTRTEARTLTRAKIALMEGITTQGMSVEVTILREMTVEKTAKM